MSKRHTSKEPSLVGAERACRAASIFLSETGRFSLAAAIFGHPLRRDHWIQQLTIELEKTNVQLTHCDVPESGHSRLIEEITAHLAKEPTAMGRTRAIVVTGISRNLPDAATAHLPGDATPRFLAEANLDRELLPQRCPHPLLLCVSPTSLGQIARFAPDLWAWCAHTFDFTEPALPDGSHPIRGIAELQDTEAGTVYANSNELLRAAGIFRTGLDVAIAAYGAEHRETIGVRAKLANVLQQLGRSGEALALTLENVRLVETIPEIPEAEIAIRIGHYAHMLQATNHLAEAEPLMRRALAVDEARLGSDHPIVALRLNNLAQLLKATNQLAEAEPLMRRALAIDEAVLGSDHPTVARRLNNLATLLQITKRPGEAEPLMYRALAIGEASFGRNDPKLAVHLNNLASLLQNTNRLADAEPLMRRALAMKEASFGSDHPDVAVLLSNLATLLKATNRFAEAEPLMRRALAMDEASFGSDHPTVGIRLNNLARLLQAIHRLDEAEPLMQRHMEIFLKFTRDTGHEHPHLKTGLNSYGALLMEMGDTEAQAQEKIDVMLKSHGVVLD